MLRAGSSARPLGCVCRMSSLSPAQAPSVLTTCHFPGDSVGGSRHVGQVRGLMRRSFKACPIVGSSSADLPDAFPCLYRRQHGTDNVSWLYSIFLPNFSTSTVVEAQEQRKSTTWTTSSLVPDKAHGPHSPDGQWLPNPFDGNDVPRLLAPFSPREPRYSRELRVCVLTAPLSSRQPLLGRVSSSFVQSLWLTTCQGQGATHSSLVSWREVT